VSRGKTFAALVLAAAMAFAGLARPALARDAAVTIVVTPPATTPAGATLHVAGDLPVLGEWSGKGFVLARRADGRHGGTLAIAAGTAMAFKITRGDWATVEKDPKGGEIANRTLVARADTTVEITVGAWRDQVDGPATPRASTLTGDIRRHAAFASKHVQARDVLVWLPPGYDADAARRYPVLYFHDGNNVFDVATSFAGVEWGIDETADRMVRAGTIPPFIAVAVANTPDRMDEYTPVAFAPHGGGRAADYARFLVDELKPFMDATYRTDPSAGATGVVGSSLGGIVSLWLGLERPDVFRRIGVVSPAAWWGERDLTRRVAAGKGTGLRVWMDIGTDEGTEKAGRKTWLTDAQGLRDALLARGYRDGLDLHYEEIEGGRHHESAWAARVDRMLEFLLADGSSKPAPSPPR
jgi:predicted alpha/beta superfamily hydrolase